MLSGWIFILKLYLKFNCGSFTIVLILNPVNFKSAKKPNFYKAGFKNLLFNLIKNLRQTC
jgi:hypothetical protein